MAIFAPDRPLIYLLIGLPASGKSTWREGYVARLPAGAEAPVMISSDDYIEREAATSGLTYSAAMRLIDMKAIEKALKVDFRNAIAAQKSVIVDRTNLSVKSRNKFLASVPSVYRRIGVNFIVPREVIDARIAARAAATGKHIPADVLADMATRYEEPTAGEFHEIITVTV